MQNIKSYFCFLSVKNFKQNPLSPACLTYVIHCIFISVLLTASLPGVSHSMVILETNYLRIEISDKGILKSLKTKPSGTEYAWTSDSGPAFHVNRGKEIFPASHVTLSGNKLVIRFDRAGVIANLSVIRSEWYIALKLDSLKGEPVDSINLLQLRVKMLPYLGTWIDVAYDENFGIHENEAAKAALRDALTKFN